MATQNRIAAEIKTPEKGYFQRFTENASQSFNKGEFVTLSGGKLNALSATNPGANTILGIALQNSENIASPTARNIVVFIPDNDCIFEVNMIGVSADADRGTIVNSTAGLAGVILADKTGAATPRWVILDIVDKQGQVVGDTDARVYAKLAVAGLQVTNR